MDKMDKILLAKNIAKLVVGASVVFTIGNVIRNNTTPKSIFQKTEVVIGATFITIIVGEVTDAYIDRTIDAFVEWHRENFPKNEELT